MSMEAVPLSMAAVYDIILEEIGITIKNMDIESIRELAELIVKKRQNRIFVAGKGRSGLISRSFAMRLLHLGFDVSVIGETTTPGIRKDDLLIISSGSGSYAIEDKKQGFELAGITANKDSKLSKCADLTIILPTPTKVRDRLEEFISLQPMGSLFEQTLFLLFEGIVLYLMMRLSVYGTEMSQRHANVE